MAQSIPGYSEFLDGKRYKAQSSGIDADVSRYGMFPHQEDLARWALRRGRAAVFADTGLGKTRIQLAWADSVSKHAGEQVIILCPLAVADQTVREGQEIDVPVTHAREPADIDGARIVVTNYDRMHKFDPSMFGAVVLDESSIIKHHDAKTLANLLEAFRTTPYKLACTATPAPNDWTELGTHAEFLGIRTRSEMLSEFFVHDGGETQKWRLKGHARELFWRWVAGWGALVRSPSDLGHDASMYDLPPLVSHEHMVKSPHNPLDGLFPLEAQTLMERRQARRSSLEDRVSECSKIVNADRNPWVVWCDLNDEGDALESQIDGAVQISGSNTLEEKESRLRAFASGEARVLVSKPKICGFGLNWQHCSSMAFVGVTDSFEAYYQAVRRCWRFGQKKEVNVHIFASDKEGSVVANLKRKEEDARLMAESLSEQTAEFVRSSVIGRVRDMDAYSAEINIQLPDFVG